MGYNTGVKYSESLGEELITSGQADLLYEQAQYLWLQVEGGARFEDWKLDVKSAKHLLMHRSRSHDAIRLDFLPNQILFTETTLEPASSVDYDSVRILKEHTLAPGTAQIETKRQPVEWHLVGSENVGTTELLVPGATMNQDQFEALQKTFKGFKSKPRRFLGKVSLFS